MPVNGPIVMSPDDSLMNMDYGGIISDGGDRKKEGKPVQMTLSSENITTLKVDITKAFYFSE